MSVKAFNKDKESFVKIASLQSGDIVVDKAEFVSNNVSDALSELKRDVKSMQSNIAWIYNNGTIGGGGGTGSGSGYTGTIQVENFNSDRNLILGDTDAAEIKFKVVSKLNNSFTVKLTVGTTVKTVTVLPNVSTTVNFGQLSQGTFNITIEAADYTGYPTESWTGKIVKGLITISSPFTGDTKYGMTSIVSIPYTVTLSSAVKRPITVQYQFDSNEPVLIENHPSGEQQYLYINKEQKEMSMGTHTVLITASVMPDGITEYSVSKTIEFVVYDPNRISMYVPSTTKTTYTLNQTATIPFNIIAAPENIKQGFDVTWSLYQGTSVSSAAIATGSVELTSGTNGQIAIFLNQNEGYTAGEYYTLSMRAAVKYSTITTEQPYNFTFNIRILAEAVDLWPVTKDSLILHCDAVGKQALSTVDGNTVWPNDATLDAVYKPGNCVVINPITNPFATNTGDTSTPAEDINFLCLYGQSYAYVDFNLIANWNNDVAPNTNLQYNGCTVEFVYRCIPNGDSNATVASYGYYTNEGNDIKLVEGFEVTANEVKFVFDGVSISNTYVMEEEWVHCSLVFEPDSRNADKMYIKVYLNGVLSGCAITDSISNNVGNSAITQLFGRICLGARDYFDTVDNENVRVTDSFSDTEFRNLKIYSKALTDKEVVINYIADEYYMHSNEEGGYDGLANAQLRSINGFDDDRNYNINSIVMPKVFVLPKNKAIADDFRKMSELMADDSTIVSYDCYIQYRGVGEGSANVNFDMLSWNNNPGNVPIIESTIKVQGTTSLQYNHKNYDICFGKWSNTNQEVLFTPKYGASNTDGGKDWLPENTFTLKADLIDSSHANNVGTANAISAICDNQQLNTQLPPMADASNDHAKSVKYAIEGFPCALYVYDNATGKYVNENEPGDASFYGVYMFDLGRTTVNNFGMQNLKINSWSSTDGTAPCLVNSYTLQKGNAGQMYALENTFIFEGSANASDNSSIDFKNTNLEQIKRDWELRFPIEGASAVSTDAYNNLRTAVVKASNYQSDWDGFADGSWNKSACKLYLLCAYVFGMADSLGKNLQLRTWDGSKWFPMFYDMDTVLGLNNFGELRWNTNLDLDKYGEFQEAVQEFNHSVTEAQAYSKSYGAEGAAGRGKGMYSTPDSRLWNAVRSQIFSWGGTWDNDSSTFTQDSFREAYRQLRVDGVLTYLNLWNFYNSVVGSIGQMMYNEDALIKYLDTNISTNNDPTTYNFPNMGRLHGTRELLTKRWLRDRLYYLDSLFDIKTSGEATRTYIKNIRSYLTGIPLDITVKTKCPVFVTSTQGDYGIEDVKLCDQNFFAKYKFFTTTGNEINHTLNNASLISYARGLYNGLATLDMGEAVNLLEIAFPGTAYLQNLTTTGMKALRTVNLRDCPQLTSTLDLSSALFLSELDISNTKMSGIVLPAGGTLRVFNAENTLLSGLDIAGQTQLETLNLSKSTDLTNVNIASCDSLRELTITESKLVSLNIAQCPSLEKVILSHNASLTNLSFENCPNVKVLDLSYCPNTSFAQYNDVVDLGGRPKNAVDLGSLINLEELILTNCSAQVILLSDSCKSLKKVSAANSLWKQTVYQTSTGYMYYSTSVVRNAETKILPALDFSRFENLEEVTFNNNKYVEAITGFNYSGEATELFAGCTALHTIKGKITFKKDASYTFYNMSNVFRLNEAYSVTPLADNLDQLTGLGLTISVEDTVSSLTNIFNQNYGVGLYDAYYFCAVINSSVKNIQGLFNWTYLQRNGIQGYDDTVSEKLLQSCKGVVYADRAFYSSGMRGIFPSKVLHPCSNLQTASYMFAQNGFTSLESTFADNVFSNTTRLTSVALFLANNRSLTVGAQYAVALDKLFAKNSDLTDCSYVLGITNTYSDGTHDSDNMYIDNTPRRGLYITFSSTDANDRLFSNTPKLRSCRGAFAKCTFAADMDIDLNIFGGVYEKNASGNYVGKDNKSAFFPVTTLTDIAYCFHDCNATIELTDQIFSKLIALTDVSGFVSGGFSRRDGSTITVSRCDKVTGDITNLSRIFANNTALERVNRFFESTNITGTIESGDLTTNAPSALFANNLELKSAEFLFKDSKISGNVPSLLFGKCPNLTSVRGLFYNCAVTGLLPGAGNRSNQILFKNLTTTNGEYASLNNLSQLFRGCSSLSSNIPDNLFYYTPSVDNLESCFYGCGTTENETSGITGSLPATLLQRLTLLKNVNYMFAGCWNLSADLTSTDELFVPVELFEKNTEIYTMRGLFQNVPVKRVAEGAFSNLTKLQDISYMFSNSDRSGLVLPASSFYYNPLISNIECVLGDVIGWPLRGSLPTLYEYFVPNNGNYGQIKLTNVTRAFAGNNTMVWANENQTMNFWDTTEWNPVPTITAGCYANCTSLQNYDSIPASYK